MSKKKKGAKALLDQLPLQSEMEAVIKGLLDRSDQAIALTCLSYIDYALQLLLVAHFRDMSKDEEEILFNPANGVLPFFSHRLRIAYATHLIDRKLFKNLRLINDIRNAFSHSLHNTSFDHPIIKEECEKLVFYPRQDAQEMYPNLPAKYKYYVSSLDCYGEIFRLRQRQLIIKELGKQPEPKKG